MAAAALQFPDFVISPEEAHQIAATGAAVLEHYPQFDVPAKMVAWTNFLGVVGFVYGSRAYAYSRHRKVARPRPVPAPVANWPESAAQ